MAARGARWNAGDPIIRGTSALEEAWSVRTLRVRGVTDDIRACLAYARAVIAHDSLEAVQVVAV